jgi:hypothetical protein
MATPLKDEGPAPYVEFGLGASYPGPFKCRGGDMRMFVLDGNETKIGEFVDKVYNGPANGTWHYEPVMPGKVILMYGLNVVSSMTSPWSEWGRVEEQLAAFWVPVWAGKRDDAGRFEAERFCMSLPHIFVDNPISLLAGREIYGFPKALGDFRFEDPGEELEILGYGGDLSPDSVAKWHPVIEITRLDGSPRAAREAEPELDESPERMVDELASLVFNETVDAGARHLGVPRGGISLARDLCRSVRRMEARQLFLKQFRDVGAHRSACYQAVVEAPARTLRIKWRLSRSKWCFRLHTLASHPLEADLGVHSQEVKWSMRITDFDFDEDVGVEVAP